MRIVVESRVGRIQNRRIQESNKENKKNNRIVWNDIPVNLLHSLFFVLFNQVHFSIINGSDKRIGCS